MAMPKIASKLVPWCTNFRDVLTLHAEIYFMSPAEITALTDVTNSFLATQNAVANPEARSGALIKARNTAQDAYYEVARPMYTAIKANPQISDEALATAGVHVKEDTAPAPVAVPNSKPLVSVIQVSGTVATITIRDINNQDKRARPSGAIGANLFTFVGENVPTPDQWKFNGQVTRTKFELELGPTLPAATKVWITACWYSARGEAGPMSDPAVAYTQAGGTTVQLGVMKIAA